MKLVRLTRKSGTRWKALVLKTQGGYVSKTFSTKGLARAWGLRTEREIEERVAKGDRAMPTITVGELVTGWASERTPLSQSYRLHSEFILPRMGSLVAAELTKKDVRSLLAD